MTTATPTAAEPKVKTVRLSDKVSIRMLRPRQWEVVANGAVPCTATSEADARSKAEYWVLFFGRRVR